jgi:hypothetical protein
MSRKLQGWRRYRSRYVFDTTKLALATLRFMREGLRFAYQLPVETGAPAVVHGDGSNPLEAYFDSVTEGPGVWKWRHYFPIYHRHLSKFVGQEVHVVEIGIYSGGSLPMWRSYFGQECQVYGIDIEPACVAHEQESIRVFIGDQADPSFLEQFVAKVPRIDVVIDDGGHQPHQQIASLRHLLPHMAMGGIYICEDIQGPFAQFHSFVDGMTRPLSQVHEHAAPLPVHQQIASVHQYPALTVVEKPERRVAPFEAPMRGTVWEPGIYDFVDKGTVRDIGRRPI